MRSLLLICLLLGAACGSPPAFPTPLPRPAPVPDAGPGSPLPPGPGHAAVRSGRIEVDGRPFFPHGYYYVSWGESPPQMLATLRTIAAAGFNTLHASRTESNGYEAFLDEAERLGIRVITEGATTEVIRTLRQKRAVLAWNIGDDAETHNTPAGLRARHEDTRAADPDRLTYFTVFNWDRWGPYLDEGDLVAPYNYPISSTRLGEVDFAVNLARRAGRPMIGIPQAFAWPTDRPPTPVEARNMVYQNLVNNVRGLIYYNFNQGPPLPSLHPELWDATRSFVPEIARLTPALTDGTFTKLDPGVDGVLAATWRLGEQRYVVVVNTDPARARSVSLALPGAPGGTLQPLFGDRPSGLQLSGGRLRGTVNPQDVHVYLVTPG